MTELRAAIVGCGAISVWHLAGWARIPEVRLAAFCDVDPAAADARRREFAPDARVYTSLDAMLAAERLDLLDIITPPACHREHCLAAARAGLHFLCQKPLAATLEDARAIAAALDGYDRLCGVHENHRYRPWFLEVAARHRAGAFGALRTVHLLQHDPYPPPERFKRDAERGVLLEYGVHLVDMTRALLGRPRSVAARLHRVNPDVRGDSLAHATLHYDGATALIDIAWKASGLYQGGALVLGDAGEAFHEGRMTRGGAARLRVVESGVIVRDEPRVPTDEYGEAFHLLERDFVDCLVNGRPFEQTPRSQLETLEIVFAAYEAARTETVVRLAPSSPARPADGTGA